MRNLWFGILYLACSSLGFGQLNSHSLRITASSSLSVQADQVVFSVSVNSSLNAGLDDVVAALRGSGITAANLSSVRNQTVSVGAQVQQTLVWAFTFPVPFSQMKNTLAALTNLQQTFPQKNNGMALTFFLLGTQASPELLQSQACSIPDLMVDARTHAQKLADTAGFFLGPVMAIASGDLAGNPVFPAFFSLSAGAVSGAVVFPTLVNTIAALPTAGGLNCSIVVEFRLN